jgi:hypothetical protein
MPSPSLISAARQSLLEEVGTLSGTGCVEEGFSAWLLEGLVPDIAAHSASQAALEAKGSERSHRHVAALGFSLGSGNAPPAIVDAFRSNVDWLVGLPAVTSRGPAAFVHDSISLLGIAVGAGALDDPALLRR